MTGYDQLMLAEFKYGLEPKETFAGVLGIDQTVPRKYVLDGTPHTSTLTFSLCGAEHSYR